MTKIIWFVAIIAGIATSFGVLPAVLTESKDTNAVGNCIALAPLARCSECGKVVGEYGSPRKVRGKPVCNEHWYSSADKCARCGMPIDGELLTDDCGRIIDSTCKRVGKTCSYCGCMLALKEEGKHLHSDGRQWCNSCNKTITSSYVELQELYYDVLVRLSEIGITPNTTTFKLRWVTQDTFRLERQGDVTEMFGLSLALDSSGTPTLSSAVSYEVQILDSLPRIHSIRTLAHELAHVWRYQHGHLVGTKVFVDGGANYASWRILISYKNSQFKLFANALLEHRDHIYGEGLRRTKKFADEKGDSVWLDAYRNLEDFPKPY